MGSLIFQNEACLVINKLAGESSEFFEFPNRAEKLFPVHRLDTPVSGCLLLARNPKAAAFLSSAFAGQGKVEKCYWAVVEKPKNGLVIPNEAILVHWISEDKKANKSFAFAEAGHGRKKAELRCRLAGEGDNYFFLEIDLITGRHHQIRAQLAACGLHVKGDLKYGAKRSEKNGGIRLHAFSLGFPNPINPNETIDVKALPPVMDSLWTAYHKRIGRPY